MSNILRFVRPIYPGLHIFDVVRTPTIKIPSNRVHHYPNLSMYSNKLFAITQCKREEIINRQTIPIPIVSITRESFTFNEVDNDLKIIKGGQILTPEIYENNHLEEVCPNGAFRYMRSQYSPYEVLSDESKMNILLKPTSHLTFINKSTKDIVIGDIIRKEYASINSMMDNKNDGIIAYSTFGKLFKVTDEVAEYSTDMGVEYSWNYFVGVELDNNFQIITNGIKVKFHAGSTQYQNEPVIYHNSYNVLMNKT